MPEYDNTNRGVLFKNDQKEEENHPDYTGKVNVKGTDFWLSAWIKTSKKGQKFMSLSVKQMEQPAQESSKKPARQAAEMDDSDIPF